MINTFLITKDQARILWVGGFPQIFPKLRYVVDIDVVSNCSAGPDLLGCRVGPLEGFKRSKKDNHSLPSSAKTMRRRRKMYRAICVENLTYIIFGNRTFCAKMSFKRDICKKLILAAIFPRWRPKPGWYRGAKLVCCQVPFKEANKMYPSFPYFFPFSVLFAPLLTGLQFKIFCLFVKKAQTGIGPENQQYFVQQCLTTKARKLRAVIARCKSGLH